jgi:cytochrome c-type biogenesis protein CcmH/NrfG
MKVQKTKGEVAMNDKTFSAICDSLSDMDETQLQTLIQSAQDQLQSRQNESKGWLLLIAVAFIIFAFWLF